MKRNWKYLTLAFLLCCVGFSSATQTNAMNLSSLANSDVYPNAQGLGFNAISNSFYTCDPSTQKCGGNYTRNYQYTCYTWESINDNGRFYYTNYPSGSSGPTSCQSPNTIGPSVPKIGTSAYGNGFGLRLNGDSSNDVFVPGVSFALNNGAIEFKFIRGSDGINIYDVSSNAGFTYDYNGASYLMTKVFFYPNMYVFSNNDGSFMFQVSAGGNFIDAFSFVSPGLSEDNLFYVMPRINKAWSTTISTGDAWNLLLGNTSYASFYAQYNFNTMFDKSYTITRTNGGTIFPTTFSPITQDSDFGFTYSEDLDFIAPGGPIEDNPPSSGGNNSSLYDQYLDCVSKYGIISQLSLELVNLDNGIGVDYDYSGYLDILDWVANFDGSYTGVNVQINNYSLDHTLVSTVNQVWNLAQGSAHTYTYYLNQAINSKSNPQNMVFYYCGQNPNNNMTEYDDPFGTSTGSGSLSDECKWWQLGCLVGSLSNNALENSFDKVIGYLAILFNKVVDPVVSSFNDGFADISTNPLECGSSGVSISVIDSLQYLLLFFIILFLLKLL